MPAQDLGFGFLNSITTAKIGPVVVVVGEAILFMAIFGLVAWFLLRPLLYKVDVFIFAKRGGGSNFVIGKDKGRFLKKRTGEQYFRLLRRKKAMVHAPFENLYLNEKGKAAIFLYKESEDSYRSFNITFADVPIFAPIDADIKNMAILEMKRDAEKFQKKGFMEKYAPYFVVIGGLVIIMIMFYMLLGKADAVAGALSHASDNLASAIRSQTVQQVPPGY